MAVVEGTLGVKILNHFFEAGDLIPNDDNDSADSFEKAWEKFRKHCLKIEVSDRQCSERKKP